jgi:hypothetical protein
MEKELTKKEKQWISRAKRLMREKPETLRIYDTDSGMCVCKAGVSSNDIQEDLGASCFFGAYLTDLHDDSDFGRGDK